MIIQKRLHYLWCYRNDRRNGGADCERHFTKMSTLLIAIAFCLAVGIPAFAQQSKPDPGAEELAKKTQILWPI